MPEVRQAKRRGFPKEESGAVSRDVYKRQDVVLDPLCGVGTIPFEACLQGRIGIGNDLSELAYVVTKAKIEKPNYSGVVEVIGQLADYIETNKSKRSVTEYEDFGFNGKLPQYFECGTRCV